MSLERPVNKDPADGQGARVLDAIILVLGGVALASHAAAAAELADGVVVGSAALDAAEEDAASLERFVASLRAAVN